MCSVPQPSMDVGIAGGTTPYIGNNLTLECLVQLDSGVSYSEVVVEIMWYKAGLRSTIASQETIVPPDMMHSTISFTYLLESHSGMYKCEATLTPRDVRTNSIPTVSSTFYDLTVIGKQFTH